MMGKTNDTGNKDKRSPPNVHLFYLNDDADVDTGKLLGQQMFVGKLFSGGFGVTGQLIHCDVSEMSKMRQSSPTQCILLEVAFSTTYTFPNPVHVGLNTFSAH